MLSLFVEASCAGSCSASSMSLYVRILIHKYCGAAYDRPATMAPYIAAACDD